MAGKMRENPAQNRAARAEIPKKAGGK